MTDYVPPKHPDCPVPRFVMTTGHAVEDDSYGNESAAKLLWYSHEHADPLRIWVGQLDPQAREGFGQRFAVGTIVDEDEQTYRQFWSGDEPNALRLLLLALTNEVSLMIPGLGCLVRLATDRMES